MNKKIIIPVIIISILALAAVIAFNKTNQTAENVNTANSTQNNNVAETAPVVTENKETAVKEFTTTSFTEIVDGQYKPQFSLREITVNKGDRVRIKITVTSGAHDFKIDELNVFADTKEINKEYVIEFTVDKAGEFVYYCAKPKHRELGQWGTLKVLDN